MLDGTTCYARALLVDGIKLIEALFTVMEGL